MRHVIAMGNAKNVIITGGNGFIGANLARRMVKDGNRVHLFVRPGSDLWRVESLRRQVRIHETDLADAGGLALLVRRIKPQWLFHCAVYGAYSWQEDFQAMIKTNIAGTVNLVAACLKSDIEAFINAGSSSEYGAKGHPAVEEESLEPRSAYGASKAAATLLCRALAAQHGLPLTTLRFYSVYGPYEHPRRLIPRLVRYGLRGRLPLLAAPWAAHDFVYIDDVVEACLLAARKARSGKGEIYNVGSGRQLQLREVVGVVRQMMGITAKPRWGSMAQRSGDTPCWVADTVKIRKGLGWKPRYSFEEGLRGFVQWLSSDTSMRELYYRRGGA